MSPWEQEVLEHLGHSMAPHGVGGRPSGTQCLSWSWEGGCSKGHRDTGEVLGHLCPHQPSSQSAAAPGKQVSPLWEEFGSLSGKVRYLFFYQGTGCEQGVRCWDLG